MGTLFWMVLAYWLSSVALGFVVATRVKTSGDFINAGQSLPLYVVIATVFATWFGAETVLGASSTFVKEGLSGVIADPFGASLCLILAGLFFAKPLYRQKLITLVDFYRRRYGPGVELYTSMAIVISYLGWVGAQLKALGLVFFVVSGGLITRETGMIAGALTVLAYTLAGGMLSVAITDLVQMVVVMLGMLFMVFFFSAEIPGGASAVVGHAWQAGKLELMSDFSLGSVLAFIAALATMGLGSIPQQDVYQRMASAKCAKDAARGAVIGGFLYFGFAFIPMFLAYSAHLLAPDLVAEFIDKDPQMILPKFVMERAPLFAQAVFFGALLSAIKSTASATLLAPSVTFAENILRPRMPRLTDSQFLRLTRITVTCFTAFVLMYALNSSANIFKMVENAYKITLVTAFVPLAAGLFIQSSSKAGAVCSIVFGLLVWIPMELFATSPVMAPQLAGLIASAVGMVLGTLVQPYRGPAKVSPMAA